MEPLQLVATLLACYLLGSISFGKIAGSIYNVDLQRVGSGNTGMTNALRTLGPKPAAFVFLGDFLKGTVAVYLAGRFASPLAFSFGSWTPRPEFWMVAGGVTAILGHIASVFLKFKGGKGAATGLGVLLGITPDLFFVTALLALALIALTRTISLVSLISVVTLSLLMWGTHKPIEYTSASLLVASIMVIRHIPNIKRLLAGKEPKIGERTSTLSHG